MNKVNKVLDKKFFNRDTETVARELLGKFLVRQIGEKRIAVMITETEAYDGFYDKASHAHKGKTKRNEVMFGHPGFFYVYFCYGMYFMLNIVTREKDYPAAVLIRGIESHNGPGKLTKFLKIARSFNNKKSAMKTNLWFEDRGVNINLKNIRKTARIGVSYAGHIWSTKKLRFILN